jgi:hypothetical protein
MKLDSGPLIELGIWPLLSNSHFGAQGLPQSLLMCHQSSVMRVASARVAPMNALLRHLLTQAARGDDHGAAMP